MKNKKGLLATKVGMTQLFMDDGVCVPVTVLHIQENTVVQKKEAAKDGYDAVQIGYGTIKEKNVNRPKKMFFVKQNVSPTRHLREFRVNASQLESYESGQAASLDWLKEVQSLDVSSTSKGKGFAGVMKRHNFGGFDATHGTHESFRGGGSIGMCEDPGKVFKGQKMAGQMGNVRVTVKNVRIIRFMEDDRVLCVRGAIPGGKGALVELRPSNRKARAIRGVVGRVEEKGMKNPMKASKAAAGKSGKGGKK